MKLRRHSTYHLPLSFNQTFLKLRETFESRENPKLSKLNELVKLLVCKTYILTFQSDGTAFGSRVEKSKD